MMNQIHVYMLTWCMEGEVWDLGLKDLQEHNQY